MPIYDSIVDLIGNTPLLRLNKVAADCHADILGKAEFFNPLGSVKDRIGANMIAAAEEAGLLEPGSLLVEPTSGNTGIALAFVSAAKGYRLLLTMPDTMSLERRALLQALGAEIELTPGSLGMQGAVDRAEAIVAETEGAVLLQQFRNEANPQAHVKTTAEEIWRDCEGDIDAIVTGVGTGGTITGITRVLKERNPDFYAVAIEPEGSPVISGGRPGPHRIQGIGAGFVPEIFDRSLVDEIITVDFEEAAQMSRRLAREEGIFVGVSAGANVAGAIRVGKRPEFEGKRIVTTLCDTGERYLSTPLFRELNMIRRLTRLFIRGRQSEEGLDTPHKSEQHEDVQLTDPSCTGVGLGGFLRSMADDIDAVLRADPAARSLSEVVLTYPGLHALWSHRVAHRLWEGGNHTGARILSHVARHYTGIEIHPGAQIGCRVFIDHGMGVVIGETTVIGDDCLIYKGVVLGGTTLSRTKRHPSLGKGVVVGSNACILGNVAVGDGARIGSSSVVIKNVPSKATAVGVPARIVSERNGQSRTEAAFPNLDHAALPDPIQRTLRELLDEIDSLSERLHTLEEAVDLSPEELLHKLKRHELQDQLDQEFLAAYQDPDEENTPQEGAE